jgi:hypothetical protein
VRREKKRQRERGRRRVASTTTGLLASRRSFCVHFSIHNQKLFSIITEKKKNNYYLKKWVG